MKKLAVFLATLGAFIFFANSVSADCVGQYGQYGQPCNSYSILVDKMVQKPGTSDYVDNLSVSDPRYKPSEYVMFKVIIKNTSTTTFRGMTAKDYVPLYLTPIEGPGTFDSASRIIMFDAGAFAVDEQKTYYFKMQINAQANLPADQGLFCLVNKAQAWSNTTTDDDSSQFCIEKQVTGTTKVPSSGPEFGLILLAGNLLGAGIGLKLRKKA
ncbi:MAG: hypothetical protein AAB788_01270 [Patescibacteria group bacterium]